MGQIPLPTTNGTCERLGGVCRYKPPANSSQQLSAGRLPLPGLKPLFPPEKLGGTPRAIAPNGNRRHAACRSGRRNAGPRCS